MAERQTLADLIVGHGRWWPGQSAQEVLHQIVDADQLNALRDELIAGREARAELERRNVLSGLAPDGLPWDSPRGEQGRRRSRQVDVRTPLPGERPHTCTPRTEGP